jgi:hypothetical protein
MISIGMINLNYLKRLHKKNIKTVSTLGDYEDETDLHIRYCLEH